MNETIQSPDSSPPTTRRERPRRTLFAVALVVAAMIGAGATSLAQKGRSVTLVALAPERCRL